MTEQRKLPQAGPRKAYFNRYIHAGTHTVPGFEGAPAQDKPQVIMGWELVEDMTDEDTPRPMWVKPFGNGNINDFNNEKAKKTRWLTNMFLEFDPENDDPKDYLGRGCRVIIKHNQGKGKFSDRTFANLVDLRDYDGELPPISQPPVFFDFYNPTPESLDKLFPWEIDYLKEAVDYPGSKLEALLNDQERNGVDANTSSTTSDADIHDNDAGF
jgi:hypothetical protein